MKKVTVHRAKETPLRHRGPQRHPRDIFSSQAVSLRSLRLLGELLLKTSVVLLLFGLFVMVNGAVAGEEATIKEAGIAFALPDRWEANPAPENRIPPTMESFDPLFLGWQREAIVDSAGRRVRPGINAVVFKVPKDTDVTMYSHQLMQQRGWPFKGFLTAEKDGLKLPNAVGYLSEFSPANDMLFRVFVIHAVHDGKFVELVFSATTEVFPSVEAELRSMIASLRVAK
ncbi:MAG: hypothetical protein AB1646_25985 [Thermodesulfobacteriota bacterium]